MADRLPIEGAAADHYLGDPAAYDRLLADYRIGPVSFERQVIETAEFLAPFQARFASDRVATERRSC